MLRNKLGIKSIELIEVQEESDLERAESKVFHLFNEKHQFTAVDICNIHHLWLKDIYSFAGNYRTVNMSKDNFPFANSNRIDDCMQKFEHDILKKYTPCNYSDLNELAYALGVVHVELILIHPFREGNGRVARLLADLMASQSNKPPLDYTAIDKTKNLQGFEEYIHAIHAGCDMNYEPIQEIFKRLILVD